MRAKTLALTIVGIAAVGVAAVATLAPTGTAPPDSPSPSASRDITHMLDGTLPTSTGASSTQVTAAAAPNCPASSRPSGYTLAYADEFNGTAVNTDDWFYRITGLYANGYNRSQNVSVADGALKLRFAHEDITGDGVKEFTGGGIMSRTNFGYGYYETCAKLFTGTSGLHTSFWSMGLRRDITGAGGDPRINQDIDAGRLAENNQLYEIDGFEHDSPDRLGLGDFVQAQGTISNRSPYQSGATRGVNYADWNLYAFEYTPAATRFYINNRLTFTIDNTTNNSIYTPQTFWLTALRLLGTPNTAALPGTSEFNYYRFYRRPFLNANLVGNGSFDGVSKAVFQAWNPPAWIESFDKPASYLISTDTYNGGYALTHLASSAYQVTTKQDLRYLNNGTYRLTARVKSSGGQSQALMRVLNFGGTERTVSLPTTNSWTLVTIDNVSVTNGQATVAFTSTASANQWIRVDDVRFVQIS